MVGIAGGEFDVDETRDIARRISHGDWCEQEVVTSGEYSMAVVHHGVDSVDNVRVWSDDGRCGVLYGVLGNDADLGLADDELFQAVLDTPDSILPRLDGSFQIACASSEDEEVVIATDKMKQFPCYHTRSGRFAFASELTALVPLLENPSLDHQTIGDFLMTDWTWGDETLLSNVADLRPASYTTSDSPERTSHRYWKFDYGSLPKAGYVRKFAEQYGAAVSEVVGSINASGSLGVWLSGGLDSRVLAALVRNARSDLETLTYDANPGGGENFEPAKRVADRLGVSNQAFEFSPDEFLEVLDEGVRLTDGMISWVNYHDLVLSLGPLRDRIDVLVSGSPTGGLIGEEMWPIHLRGGRGDGSAVDQAFHRHARMDPDEFDALLTEDIDPKASIRADFEESAQPSLAESVLDVEYRNFNPNYHARRDNIFRSQVSVVSPFGSGEFLDHVVKMPDVLRQSTIPFSGGRLNHPTSRLKVELAREVDDGIERVPYERTELDPRWPFVLHTGIYFAKRVLQKTVTGTNASNTMYGEWFRDHPGMRRKICDLLDGAADRPLFQRAMVEDIRDQHLHRGRNRIRPIAVLSTIECWRQNHLD